MGTTQDIEMAEAPPPSSRSSSLSPPPSELPDAEFDILSESNTDLETGPAPEPAPRIASSAGPHSFLKEPSPTRSRSPVDQTLADRPSPPKRESAPLALCSPGKPPSPVEENIPLERISISSPTKQDDMAPVRRSGRQAKASQKLISPDDKPAATPKVVIKKPNPPRRKKWTAEKLLTDEKSPLVEGDIRAMLCAPEAWDILTQAERAEIIALLPAGTPILQAGTPDTRPDMMALASDDSFRHDCAMYAENLGDGKHDAAWLEEAWTAHDERAAGEFEEYLEHHFEEEWGVKLPDDMKRSLGVVRDDSSPSREKGTPTEKGKVNGKEKAGSVEKEKIAEKDEA